MKKKSYEKIDYRIRTRKFIERRMMLDSCQKLIHFDKLSNYKYIGFGSLYFVDFKIFHKYLGIKDMVSIEFEDDENLQKRFDFNKPYSFIKMSFNKSTEALRKMSFDKRSIVWLDYDSNLSTYMFEDIEVLIDRMKSGSMFAVSLNTSIDGERTSKLCIELNKIKDKFSCKDILVRLKNEDVTVKLKDIILSIKNITNNNNSRNRIKKELKKCLAKLEIITNKQNIKDENVNYLIESFDKISQMLSNGSYCKEKLFRKERFMLDFKEYIPNRPILENELSEKQSHKIIKELFDIQINKQLELINQGKTENERIEYKQLFYFTYKDNARMMTIGGVLYKKSEQLLYENANFNELEFIRENNENYEIEVPVLTLKERQYLDNDYMFNDEVTATNEVNGEENWLSYDRGVYNSLHRYLPNFMDVDQI